MSSEMSLVQIWVSLAKLYCRKRVFFCLVKQKKVGKIATVATRGVKMGVPLYSTVIASAAQRTHARRVKTEPHLTQLCLTVLCVRLRVRRQKSASAHWVFSITKSLSFWGGYDVSKSS